MRRKRGAHENLRPVVACAHIHVRKEHAYGNCPSEREKSQGRANTTSNELTRQEAYTRGDSCIGRPVIVGQNQENGGGKKTDLYDREVSFDVTGGQNYVCGV